MNFLSIQIRISFFLALLTPLFLKSQIAISNTAHIQKIKNGTTYVAMKDPTDANSQPYIEALKASWNFSKIDFIKYSEIQQHLAPENSFLVITSYETTTQFYTRSETGSRRNGINYSNGHLYLELWTCTDKFFETGKKNFSAGSKVQIARIELYNDFESFLDPDKIYQAGYDGDGHIRNWGPGILKNYIQTLMNYLQKAEKQSLYAEYTNQKELKNLTKETLYIPDFTLVKLNKFNGDERKRHDLEDIMGDYEQKYKLIKTTELNQSILNNQKMYYLVYVKSSTDKYISVINSQTGEIIYTRYTPLSYNIKSGDLKELNKAILN